MIALKGGDEMDEGLGPEEDTESARRKKTVGMVYFCAFFCFAAIVTGQIVFSAADFSRKIEESSGYTIGTILAKSVYTNKKNVSTFYVSYSFDYEGRKYNSKSRSEGDGNKISVDPIKYAILKTGGDIKIRFSKKSPEFNEPAFNPSWDPTFLFLLGCFFCTLFGALSVFFLVKFVERLIV